MTNRFAARLAACLLAVLSSTAAAQNNGELWEINTQMNIPGMPAGMGAQTARVCQGNDAAQNATRGERQDCKVVDVKQTSTRTTVTMTCPDGRAVIDQQYNAARTEFKGSMRFSGRDGEMVMNTTGRKVGACNVQEARKANEQKGAKMKADADRQIAAAGKETSKSLIKACTEAVTAMDAGKFPMQLCYRKDDPAYGTFCNQDKATLEVLAPKEGRAACDARRAEFCKKLPGDAGLALSRKAIDSGAALCGQPPQKVVATLCSRAVKADAYQFMGRNCPVEAKPLFQKNCAGRDFTSIQDKKVRDMCTALASLDEQKPRSAPAATSAKPAEAPKPTVADKAEKGISEGINKLRGLFGR